MEYLKSDQANLVPDKNSPQMISPTWTCINVSSKLTSNEIVVLREIRRREKEIFRHGYINLRHEAKLQQCKFNVNRTSFPPSNTPRIRIQISSSRLDGWAIPHSFFPLMHASSRDNHFPRFRAAQREQGVARAASTQKNPREMETSSTTTKVSRYQSFLDFI